MDTDPTLKDLLGRFENHLLGQGKSVNTIRAYTRDMRLFGEWFRTTNGKPLAPGAITPIDVRQYRSHLLTVKGAKPATANRKLASLSAFCRWAREGGLVPANPVEGIGQVEEMKPAPRWLDKRGQYALLRAVQERGRVRDVALITLMLNTGLRVSEVARLKVSEVKISPRKGSVAVRGGKGNVFRTVPLNLDARKAIQAYLEERPEVEGDHLFVGQRGEQLRPAGFGVRKGVHAFPQDLVVYGSTSQLVGCEEGRVVRKEAAGVDMTGVFIGNTDTPKDDHGCNCGTHGCPHVWAGEGEERE